MTCTKQSDRLKVVETWLNSTDFNHSGGVVELVESLYKEIQPIQPSPTALEFWRGANRQADRLNSTTLDFIAKDYRKGTRDMARWTKAAAIRRMQADEMLKRVIAEEPRVKPLVDSALRQKNVRGYNRIETYYGLKHAAERLVGWIAKDAPRELQTKEAWDAVVLTIADLLPPDDVDLYPDGKPDDDEDE